MFKNGWAGTWLLIGLVGSVLLRGTLWVLTGLNLGLLLGPVGVLLSPAAGAAIWLVDVIASFAFAVATGVACHGLRGDRAWAYRLGRGLAWFYVAGNAATAAVCAVLVTDWSMLGVPLVLYIVSLAVALAAGRQLQVQRGSAMVVGITSLRRLAAGRAGTRPARDPRPAPDARPARDTG